MAGTLIDDDHSAEEERFLLLGYSRKAQCLVVSHCSRENDSVVRLISVRRVTAEEEQMYWSLSMRNEYDFSTSSKNPYSKQLKRQITIRLDTATVDYFKDLGAELGMPYQNIINLPQGLCRSKKQADLSNGFSAGCTTR